MKNLTLLQNCLFDIDIRTLKWFVVLNCFQNNLQVFYFFNLMQIFKVKF